MAKTEESKLEEQVEKYMKSKRIWQLARYQAQSNQFGIPDRLYLYKGYLLGLELKTKTGTPTDLQLRKINSINENGGIGTIIRDVKEVELLIDTIDKYDKYTVNLASSIRTEFIETRGILEKGKK